MSVVDCCCTADWQGYLRALGMSRTAQVKRDARMGEAEAHRDAGIRVSLAVRLAVILWEPIIWSVFLNISRDEVSSNYCSRI